MLMLLFERDSDPRIVTQNQKYKGSINRMNFLCTVLSSARSISIV